MAMHKELRKITRKFAKNYDWELCETPVYKGKTMETKFFDTRSNVASFLMTAFPNGIYLMNHYSVQPMTSADLYDPRTIFCIRFAPKDKP
jgi:hypothetical protein